MRQPRSIGATDDIASTSVLSLDQVVPNAVPPAGIEPAHAQRRRLRRRKEVVAALPTRPSKTRSRNAPGMNRTCARAAASLATPQRGRGGFAGATVQNTF